MRFFITLALLNCTFASLAQERGEKPALVLDSGGHTGRIWDVAFTPDGKQLLTVSYDKTVRLWDLKSGESIRTYRTPIGPGSNGLLIALALAPDGETIAVGGRGVGTQAGPIYLISLRTNQIVQILRGHKSNINTLAFSPNGKLLASASNDQTARIWDLRDGECRAILKGHTHENVNSIVFSADGERVVTSSQDKTVRIWSAATGALEMTLRHNGLPLWATFSPDGKTVVTTTGYALCFWQTSGKFIKEYDLKKNLYFAKYLGDGKEILVAGGVTCVVNADSGKARNICEDDIVGAAISKDGQTIATTDPSGTATLWDRASGKKQRSLRAMSKPIWSAAWSADGRAIVFGTQGERPDVVNREFALTDAFDLEDLSWTGLKDTGAKRRIVTSLDGYRLERKNDLQVTISKDGSTSTLALPKDAQFEQVYSMTFWGDKRVAIGATELYVFDAATRQLKMHHKGHIGEIWALSPSPDGKYLLSGSNDHTVRIWTHDKEQPILSLVFAGKEWIAWAPEGYYAASPGGEKLMGWQSNNGLDKLATFSPSADFHKTYYRPDVIKRLLQAGSIEKAIELADRQRGTKTEAVRVDRIAPPRVTILSPAKSGTRIGNTRFEVKVAASGDGYAVASLRLLVDGRPYEGEKSLRTVRSPRSGEVREAWAVELTPGVHRLAVVAASAVSQALSDEIEVVVSPGKDSSNPPTVNLHLLAIGINSYPGKMALDCPVPDAKLVDQTFRNYSKNLYQVQSTMLLDRQATRLAILQGLDDLQKKTKAGDVAVVFYAGHGDCKRTGQFHILPVDVNVKELAKTGISGEELRAKLARLPCTAVLIMDCCYAGSFDATKKKRALPTQAGELVRELVSDDQGLVVMCGASRDEESIEERGLGHGYFTKALTEGLSGKAASTRDGLVYLGGLQTYIEERVRVLSDDEQYPTMGKPTLIRSFPLASPFASSPAK